MYRFVSSFSIALIALLMLGLAATPGLADDLSYFEERRLKSSATKALESGDLSTASELFAELAEGSTGDRRAEALYFGAVAEIADADGDTTAARERLDTLLDEMPNHETAPQARALVRLFDQIADVQKEVAQVDAAMASAARQAEQQGDKAEEAAGEAESLAGEVARLVKELKATRAELAKKEEALEKLKKVVVGGDG